MCLTPVSVYLVVSGYCAIQMTNDRLFMSGGYHRRGVAQPHADVSRPVRTLLREDLRRRRKDRELRLRESEGEPGRGLFAGERDLDQRAANPPIRCINFTHLKEKTSVLRASSVQGPTSFLILGGARRRQLQQGVEDWSRSQGETT